MRNFTDQECWDLLTTAVEGGIGYWSVVVDSERAPDLSWVWVDLKIEDYESEEDDTVYRVDADKIRAAFTEIYAKQSIRSDLLDQMSEAIGDEMGAVDADVADCVVQWACFGGLVYG
jgi:hypothetical protein